MTLAQEACRACCVLVDAKHTKLRVCTACVTVRITAQSRRFKRKRKKKRTAFASLIIGHSLHYISFPQLAPVASPSYRFSSMKSAADVIDFLPCSIICLSPNLATRLSIYSHISRICIPPFGDRCTENDWTICCMMLRREIKFIDWIRCSSFGVGDHFNHAPTASIKKK